MQEIELESSLCKAHLKLINSFKKPLVIRAMLFLLGNALEFVVINISYVSAK